MFYICSWYYIDSEVESGVRKHYLSVSVVIIANSKHFKMILKYGNQCFMWPMDVNFAHFGTTFCQDILII